MEARGIEHCLGGRKSRAWARPYVRSGLRLLRAVGGNRTLFTALRVRGDGGRWLPRRTSWPQASSCTTMRPAKLPALAFGECACGVLAIVDMPDNVSMFALSVAVSASDFVRTKTIPLLSVEEAEGALAKSRTC